LIKVIGTKGCSRCITIKNILTSKNIDYEYLFFDELMPSDKEKFKNLAEENNQFQFPLIIKDEKLIDIKDIL
jgi:glutaredoxin